MMEKNDDLYQQAKLKVSEPFAILSISEEKTTFRFTPGVMDGYKALPLGYKTISNTYFRHNPPTESEIEAAITIIEDELMLLVPGFRDQNLKLVSFDERMNELVSYTISGNKSISTAEVEGIFTRLAAIITGRPASMDVLPTDNDFIAYVLIIREVLHHLKFDKIDV